MRWQFGGECDSTTSKGRRAQSFSYPEFIIGGPLSLACHALCSCTLCTGRRAAHSQLAEHWPLDTDSVRVDPSLPSDTLRGANIVASAHAHLDPRSVALLKRQRDLWQTHRVPSDLQSTCASCAGAPANVIDSRTDSRRGSSTPMIPSITWSVSAALGSITFSLSKFAPASMDQSPWGVAKSR